MPECCLSLYLCLYDPNEGLCSVYQTAQKTSHRKSDVFYQTAGWGGNLCLFIITSFPLKGKVCPESGRWQQSPGSEDVTDPLKLGVSSVSP